MATLEHSFKTKRPPLKIAKAVLFALFMREIQTRFDGRRMGFLWVIFEPLAILTVVMIFHAHVLNNPVKGVDFVVYMVSGIVPFNLMRSIPWRMIDSIQANQGLFAYRQVTPFSTFIARVIVEICIYSFVYFVICFFLGVWFDHDVLIDDPLAWLVAIAVGILLSFAIGLLYAIIGNALPNSGRILKLSYIPIYVTAGVFYPLWRMPKEKVYYMSFNPYVAVIDRIRAGMITGYPASEGLNLMYPVIFSLVVLIFSLMVYRRRRQNLRVFNA
ncbi:ABC transporter permease [Burkholderia multivorans]|uniref:ABC transporter permease n=1 Tax=Burkholderia multivorans TaxID=87883 RepID=UPI000D001159|nr:ABC transporter permease [Burkholderia multivorans]PRE86559.1 ABC transporter [Burkholderia multivorans]